MSKKDKQEIEKIIQAGMKDIKDDELRKKLEEELHARNAKEPVAEKKRGKFKFNLKYVMAVAACLVIVAIVVPCVILLPQSNESAIPENPTIEAPEGDGGEQIETPEEDKPHYGVGDEVLDASSVEELNAEFSDYRFNSEHIQGVTLVRDDLTNDKLYYHVAWQNEYSWCDIYVIVNSDYEFLLGQNPTETVIVNDLEVGIKEKSEEYSDGVYMHTCYAQTQIDGYDIYFVDYTSVTTVESSKLIECIKEVLEKAI